MEDLNEILVRHFEGKASREEEAVLEAWKVENAREYELLKKVWTESDLHASPVTFNTEKAWTNVYEKAVKKNKVFSLFQSSSAIYRMAAGLFLVLGLLALWKFGFNSAPEKQELAFQNPGTQVKEIILPDGSQISLKHHAELVYESGNTKQRKMTLSGEAFFEVKKDAAHPFVISLKQGTVTVLGTSFNIASNDSLSTVSVRTGLVKLSFDEDSILLKAGEMGVARKAGLSDVKSTDPNYLSWKTGEFVFENAPLQEIIKSLNEYYGNRFACAGQSNCKLTTHFKNNSVEEIEQTIKLICGGETLHRGDKIIFQ